MIAPEGHDDVNVREIARGLAAAVRAAVDPAREPAGGTHALAWGAAIGVADLLELAGLSALLVACEPHAVAPPLAVTHVLERLARLATETEARGDIAPFVAADRELGALAGVLDAQEWMAESAPESTPVAVQSLSAVLADFDVDDPEAVAKAQLTLQVCAGLRAALEWLGADAGGRLRVSVHDAALTLSVRVMHEPGLAPAGAVLALMSGSLLPEPDGRWLVRVPLQVARPAFLLARQGALALAVPWHAVTRLRIADDTARAALTEPSLVPWSPLEREQGERPAVLIAQGLVRAWLHLDHIVWRIFAGPEPGRAPATVPGSRLCVHSEEGGEYWVVDVDQALAGVPPLHTPAPGRPPHAHEAATPSGAPVAAATPHTAGSAAAGVEPKEPAAESPAGRTFEQVQPLVLTSEHVRPLTLTTGHVRPLASGKRREVGPALEPTPAPFERDERDALPPPPVELEAAAVRPIAAGARAAQPRRALVVDDSLVARMALTRVLEREGWWVEGVERAEEMWGAMDQAEWDIVFVDVSLPDAQGRSHLRALVERRLAAAHPFELVALTRDGAERAVARDAGIERALRKPFAAGAIIGLLRELPAPGSGA